jgi:hypothetical protein
VPTPVGPVPPDPNDPDLWPEWYEDDDAHVPRRVAVRAVALLVALALVVLLVASVL